MNRYYVQLSIADEYGQHCVNNFPLDAPDDFGGTVDVTVDGRTLMALCPPPPRQPPMPKMDLLCCECSRIAQVMLDGRSLCYGCMSIYEDSFFED